MTKGKVKEFSFLLFFLVFLFAPICVYGAVMLSEVRDLISTSAPGEMADHLISFKVIETVPTEGELELKFEEGFFDISEGFSFYDMELKVKDPDSEEYESWQLGGAIDISENISGVTVESGTSGRVLIELSDDILSNSKVKIALNSYNAPEEEGGDYGIFNPPQAGSYKVNLRTMDSEGELLNRGTTMVAIVEPISVRSWPKPDEEEEEDWEEGEEEEDDEVADPGEGGDDTGEDTDDGGSSPGGGGGGGGGGSGGASGGDSGDEYPLDTGTVIFEGMAYPNSEIVILKDGKIASEERISDSLFIFRLSEMEHGSYSFGVYARDQDGNRSPSERTTMTVRSNTTNRISDIFIPPTIAPDGSSVDPGDVLELSGSAWPEGDLEIEVLQDGDAVDTERFSPDGGGGWIFEIDTEGMRTGTYEVRARSWLEDDSNRSDWSKVVFGVGVEPDVTPELSADLNKDGKVNLADFSIMLFHWGTGNSTADVNKDGSVGLSDFSMMLYQWTG